MRPFFSAVVPVYKAEAYLNECVDSILKQSFGDFELLLVDDGSPDNCPAICDEYAREDPRVQVLHKPNGGQTSARKAGVNCAAGEYIIFVDADDWLERDMMQTVFSALNTTNADIVLFDMYVCYGREKKAVSAALSAGLYDKGRLIRELYPTMLYAGEFYRFGVRPALWDKVCRTSIIRDNLQRVDNSIRIGEDGACTYGCLLQAETVFVLENAYLYNYRQLEESISKKYDSSMLKKSLLLIKCLRAVNRRYSFFDLLPQIDYYFLFLVRWALYQEFQENAGRSLKQRYETIDSIARDEMVGEVLKRVSLQGFPKRSKLLFTLLKKKKDGLLFLLIFAWSALRRKARIERV